MELLTSASALEKSPLKDVTNSTPTPGAAIIQATNSPRKLTKSRSKRSSSITNSPQRRSTRLSSSRSEPHPKEAEKEEELSPVRTTRSGRKVTPRVTGRKRTTKKDIQEDSVAKRRRTRRSISTLPSSPLAEKQGDDKMATTPTRPRMTRSSSMSGTEGSSIKTDHSSITVIIESNAEADEGNQSPLAEKSSHNIAMPEITHIPFKEFPLPASPIKLAPPVATPKPPPTQLVSTPFLKPIENDIFAISPGMFPRKTKPTDYLDVLADSDRTEFISPVKQEILIPSYSRESDSIAKSDTVPEIQANPILDETEHHEAVTTTYTDQLSNIHTVNAEPEEDHPHFALLSYLAEVAAISDHLPEHQNHMEDTTHGSIEDILTAAALAESMKEEIFTVVEEDPTKSTTEGTASESEEEDVDIMTIEEGVVETKETNELITVVETDEPEEVTAAESLTTNLREPAIEESIIPPTAEENLKTTAPGEESQKQDQDDTLDLESLLTLSEATDYNIEEQTQDIQIPVGQSIKDALDELSSETINSDEEFSTVITKLDHPASAPSDSVGFNQVGQFVVPQFTLFQDVVDTGRKRKSLDPTTVFEIPVEPPINPSPLKLQSQEFENLASKRRNIGPALPNTTRLDVLRKRANRVRSREARHNIKRRDISAALQPILDNLPSPTPKVAVLKHTPALIPPSLVAKRLQSPITPAPTKRARLGDEGQTPLLRQSPTKLASVKEDKENIVNVSPRKQIFIRATPIKGTPKAKFEFNFGSSAKEKILTSTTDTVSKFATPRYEVYSKIFGPPPQIQKSLVEKDGQSSSKVTESTTLSQSLASPAKKQKVVHSGIAPKQTPLSEISQTNTTSSSSSVLGKPMRNDTFAVPTVPVAPGPPQLPPSQRHSTAKTATKRFANGVTTLPSPAKQPPPSVSRSALPRLSSAFGSALPVPSTTRRSTRVPSSSAKTSATNKPIATTVATDVAVGNGIAQNGVVAVDKKGGSGEGIAMDKMEKAEVEKVVVEPVIVSENVTLERPKGKLGGAQRVTRNGENNKKQVVEAPTRPQAPTRPATPPLTSLSQKELKSLTDLNTKRNEGFKTVNLQSTVKKVNKKRPGEPSDDFMVGKGGKWSKGDAPLDWDRNVTEDIEFSKVKWKSPRFMMKAERRGALRVKGILKKKKDRVEKEDEGVPVGKECEILVVQRFVYKGEKE